MMDKIQIVTLTELEEKASEILQYKSGSILLICTVIIKKIELNDLQKLTDRCIREERERSET